jgi:hypothetical protein
MNELKDITNDPTLEAKVELAVINEIKRRLPNAPIHEIATFIVKNAPDNVKKELGTDLVQLLTFKQIHTARQADQVSHALFALCLWETDLSNAITIELANRLKNFLATAKLDEIFGKFAKTIK